MFGVALGAIKASLQSKVRQTVMTIVFALIGAILLMLALGFGIAALFEWLKFHYGTLPALGILGGTWAVLGVVFLLLAFYRPEPGARARKQRAALAAELQNPAAAIATATEQAVDSATGLIREGSRQQVFGALLVAVLAGFILGRRL
jgi:hypothetical protein